MTFGYFCPTPRKGKGSYKTPPIPIVVIFLKVRQFLHFPIDLRLALILILRHPVVSSTSIKQTCKKGNTMHRNTRPGSFFASHSHKVWLVLLTLSTLKNLCSMWRRHDLQFRHNTHPNPSKQRPASTDTPHLQ